MKATEIDTKRKPTKVIVRKLEKLETTLIIDPGCRNDLCS